MRYSDNYKAVYNNIVEEIAVEEEKQESNQFDVSSGPMQFNVESEKHSEVVFNQRNVL